MSSSTKISLPHSALNHFLRSRKQAFLSSASNAPPCVVMGNEAGDLDSLACAISYSYLSSLLSPPQEIFPFVQTERKDLHLRPENQSALRTCLIDPEHLICVEDIEDRQLGKLSLVDHNKLSSRFKNRKEEDVVGIIDHHEDEKLYNSASPRMIVPPTSAGSCASVLSLYFKSILSSPSVASIPPELATLLLSAIAIDTHALDPKVGKAKADDLDAVNWLLPISTFKKPAAKEAASTDGDASTTLLSNTPAFSDLHSFHSALSEAKNDVSSLNTVDLIRRDYKEYSHPSPTSTTTWSVGLTSVPTSLKDWISRVGGSSTFLSGCSQFCSDRKIQLLGILTAFVDESGQFKREILLYSPASASSGAKKVAETLVNERKGELEMVKIEIEGLTSRTDGKDEWFECFDQKVLKATRKQVAPAVKEACAKVDAPK